VRELLYWSAAYVMMLCWSLAFVPHPMFGSCAWPELDWTHQTAVRFDQNWVSPVRLTARQDQVGKGKEV